MKLSRFALEVLLPCGHDTAPFVDTRHTRFKITPGPSRIDRWGLFAAASIPRRRVVIDYTGERINEEVAEFRMMRERLYLFAYDDEWTIDGAIGGSGAQFVNHSCDPNLTFRRWRGRIFFLSLRRIRAGEELTIDYRLSTEFPVQSCGCGTANCRGIINRP